MDGRRPPLLLTCPGKRKRRASTSVLPKAKRSRDEAGQAGTGRLSPSSLLEPPLHIICPRKRKRCSSEPSSVGTKKRREHHAAHSPIRSSTPQSPPSQPQEDFNPSDYINVVSTRTKYWKRGPVKETAYTLIPTKDLDTSDRQEHLLRLLEIMKAGFQEMVNKAPLNSQAQVFLVNDKLNKSCIASHRLPASELTFESIAERLAAAIQSDEAVKLQDTVFYLSTYTPTVQVGAYGSSVRSRHEYSIQVWEKNKHCLNDPMTKRNRVPHAMKDMCVPLVLAKELYCLENPKMTLSSNMLRNYGKSAACRQRAHDLVAQAGLQPALGPFTVDQLPAFAKCLPQDVTLSFYDDSAPPFLHLGPSGPPGPTGHRRINIFLVYNSEESGEAANFHAYGITSMKAFMGTKYFCYGCFKGHWTQGKRGHQCPSSSCRLCKYINCKNRENERKSRLAITCPACNIYFNTDDCFAAHAPACGDSQKCTLCAQTCKKSEFASHPCGTPFCPRCKTCHSPFNFCYVNKEDTAKAKISSVWYGDCETQVDPETKDHHANLVVLQRHDGGKFVEFKGPDAMEQFTRACMTKGSIFKNSTVVFHNAAGFDAHLWYKELLKAKAPPKKITRKGQKIIGMTLSQNEIKCRDSLQFIPGTPLAAFPKMFGLESGPKGDFPHGLNTPEWIHFGSRKPYQEKVNGVEYRFPQLHYFWPEHKSSKQLRDLKQWHAEMVTKYEEDPTLEYVPEDELVSYCRQDVRILRQGFEKYRETWLAQYPTLEPLQNLTFPSYNNRIFREEYMTKDSLCMLPPMGYENKNQPYSVSSLAWIAWQERELGLEQVRTARKGYEVRISGHRVDATGIDAQGTRHVLQFHGCYWHGHLCQKKRDETQEVRQENTLAIDEHLQTLAADPKSPYGPFVYHTVYECHFWAATKKDAKMRAFVKDYVDRFPREPLRPRHSLRGGRTNAIHHRIVPVNFQAGWRLVYVDFTSLYPAVNFGTRGEVWPVGHPDIYIGKDLDRVVPEGETWSSDWFGFASLEIHPPRKLLHPVLGQSINDKLLFHLCTTCARELHQGPCPHSDEQRLITGTFFTGEIELAIKNGYRVKKVHELWTWPLEQRDPLLFRQMIKDQYAKKALASVVPKDPVEFQKLIDEYASSMDLKLEPSQFKENSALRALAKFSLNNIWGFLGKRNDVEETEFVGSFSRFLELQNDSNVDITRVMVSDDEEKILVTFKSKSEEANRNGNICLAAMTTAYARIALYQEIAKYPREVVYMDTDSLFILLPPGMDPPPTSTVLGALKDEVKEDFGPDAFITQFSSIGPKSYTYRVENSAGEVLKEEVKMKGIRFNAEASQIVSASAMQDLTDHPNRQLVAPQYQIRKDLFKTRLWNTQMLKKVRFQSRKRWFLPSPNPTMDTRPYGFCD